MQADRPQSGRRVNRQGRGRPQQNGGDMTQPNEGHPFQAPMPWSPSYAPRDVHPAIAAQQAGFFGQAYPPSPYPPQAMMFPYAPPRPDQNQAMMLSYAYPPQFSPNGYPPMPMAFHPQALQQAWPPWQQAAPPQFHPQLQPQFQRPGRPQSQRAAAGRGGGRASGGSRRNPARGPPSSPGSAGSASTHMADQLAGLTLQRRRVGSHQSLSGSAYSADLDGLEPLPSPVVGRTPTRAQPPPVPGARPKFALDVECFATGTRCMDRKAAEIAVVDEQGNKVLHLYVRPQQPVVSYITELTGLTKELLEERGVPFDEARRIFMRTIPKSALLIGYNIDSDLGWLKLTDPDQEDPERKEDRDVIDVMGLYKKDPETGRYNRKPASQDHLVRVLLGEEVAKGHDAVGDAIKSMRLYHLFFELEKDKAKHAEALAKVDSTPREPSFAMKHETYEGVCMGGRSCKCDYSDKPWVAKPGPVVYNKAAPAAAEGTNNGDANADNGNEKNATNEGAAPANGTNPTNPTAANNDNE